MKLVSRMLSQAFAPGWDIPQSSASEGEIEQLSRTAGAQFHESLECPKISHVSDCPHVAFDICGDIGAEPVGRVQTIVEYAGI